MEHEKIISLENCNMKRAQHKESAARKKKKNSMKIVQYEQRVTRKKGQHEKSAPGIKPWGK